MSKSDDCGSSASAGDVPMTGDAPGILPMDVVISFDTTGSMSSYLDQVRSKMSEIIERLFTDLPTLRIGIIAHGDYCDKHTYITKHHQLSNDVGSLVDFVKEVRSTGGGDWEECYELVLHEARLNMNWSKGDANRALIMIGDAIPHEPNYSLNKKKLNWRNETLKLHEELEVKIYGVQCGKNSAATPFYKKISNVTGGKHLDLTDLGSIVDMLMAICYRERGAEMFDAFEKEIREREGAALKADLDDMLKNLRAGDEDVDKDDSSSDLTPKPSVFRKASSLKLKRSESLKKGRAIKVAKRRTASKKAGAAKKDSPKRHAAKTVADKKAISKAKRKLDFGSDSDSESESETDKPKSKAVKTAKTVDKNTKKDINTRVNRESMKTDRFSTEDGLTFGNWRLAISPKKFVSKSTKISWSNSGKGLLVRKQLWTNCKAKALYEIAIQSPYKRKMGVACVCSKWSNPALWKKNLINKALEEKTMAAVHKGYKVFIRRAPLPLKTKSLRSSSKTGPQIIAELNNRFDYAWHQPMRDVY